MDVPTTVAAGLTAAEAAALHAVNVRCRERVEAVAQRCVELYSERFAAYAAVPADDLLEAARTGILEALDVLDSARPITAAGGYAAALGEARARQGVPVDALMQTFHAGAHEALVVWDEEARAAGVAPTLVLGVHDAAWAWANSAMTQAARAHRRVAAELARHDEQRHAHFVRDLVLGRLSRAELERGCAVYGLAATEEHRAVRVRCAAADLLPQAERAVFGAAPGATALIDGDLAGVVTAGDAVPAAAGEGTVVAVGPPAPLTEIASSFAAATSVLRAAAASGLTGGFDATALGLLPTVLAADAIGDALVAAHLGPVAGARFGAELIASAEAFLAHDRRVEATAAALGIHTNTLRHRLARFEELSGLDLRRTEAIVRLWWALARRRMTAAG